MFVRKKPWSVPVIATPPPGTLVSERVTAAGKASTMMTDVMEVADRAKAKMEAAAVGIMHDICSLDPLRKKLTPDNPDLLVLTVQDLDLILRRHLKGEDV